MDEKSTPFVVCTVERWRPISGQTSFKIQLASDTSPNSRCMTFVQVWLLHVVFCASPLAGCHIILLRVRPSEVRNRRTNRVECQPNLFKMGWKSSLAIHLGFWFYLVGGGAIYFYIEDPYYHLPAPPKRNVTNYLNCFDLHSWIVVSERVESVGVTTWQFKTINKSSLISLCSIKSQIVAKQQCAMCPCVSAQYGQLSQ